MFGTKNWKKQVHPQIWSYLNQNIMNTTHHPQNLREAKLEFVVKSRNIHFIE